MMNSDMPELGEASPGNPTGCSGARTLRIELFRATLDGHHFGVNDNQIDLIAIIC
jgi:hypothetical protein